MEKQCSRDVIKTSECAHLPFVFGPKVMVYGEMDSLDKIEDFNYNERNMIRSFDLPEFAMD